MPTSTQANLPRWRHQPGFFEIWFLVVHDPGGERAWWLRYTLFSPAPGLPGTPRATVWAAAFDTRSPTPALALKSIHPITAFETGPGDHFGLRIGESSLDLHHCRGEVASEGHAIAWDLRCSGTLEAGRREPRGLEFLPLPTHVATARDDVTFSGTITVDGRRWELKDAPGLQKHLWGTRRVEELIWLSFPRFYEDPDARLEALSVRVAPGVRVNPLYLRTRTKEHRLHEVPGLLAPRLEMVRPGEVRLHAVTPTLRLEGRATCDPRTLAGYDYRDPEGWDVHVAQSDVARCELELFSRPHPLARWCPAGRLTSSVGALELHGPRKLDGVRYIGWDETALPDPRLQEAS